MVSPRAVIALASRSVGLTFITQAISGAKIAMKAIENSSAIDKIACFDMRFIKPLDERMLHEIFKEYENKIKDKKNFK